MPRTVVFVHSYCLNGSEVDKSERLTSMATKAMQTGIEIMRQVQATDIIVSAAYDTWQREFGLQKKLALSNGISENQIYAIAPIKDSCDEAQRAITKAIELGAKQLIVIAEEWHARRSKKIFRAICPEGLGIGVVPFKSPRFEVTLEPSTIKSLRTGLKSTWILWNKIFELLTPLILRMKR